MRQANYEGIANKRRRPEKDGITKDEKKCMLWDYRLLDLLNRRGMKEVV